MQSKFLLILPISIIGLLSCMPDSTPKSLTYEETLSYINKNYKGIPSNPTGYVEYTCEDPDESKSALEALGVKTPISTAGSNQIDAELIKNYISYSGDPSELSRSALPLMYLTPSNFKTFIEKSGCSFTYQLTYVKELVMTATIVDLTYTRYYNTSLHLTRFEVNCSTSNESYTATQSFIY